MTTLIAQGSLDRRVGRRAALRALAKKRSQARALHDCALTLGLIPGRERDANNVSKEAAIADAEIRKMLADMTTDMLNEADALLAT